MKSHNFCAVPKSIPEGNRHPPERKKIYAMTPGIIYSGIIYLYLLEYNY